MTHPLFVLTRHSTPTLQQIWFPFLPHQSTPRTGLSPTQCHNSRKSRRRATATSPLSLGSSDIWSEKKHTWVFTLRRGNNEFPELTNSCNRITITNWNELRNEIWKNSRITSLRSVGLRRVSGNYFPKVSGSTTNLVVLSPLSLRRFSSEVKRKAKTAKIMLDGCLFRNCRMRMIATNYIEIYIVRGYDEKIGRKYVILAVLT